MIVEIKYEPSEKDEEHLSEIKKNKHQKKQKKIIPIAPLVVDRGYISRFRQVARLDKLSSSESTAFVVRVKHTCHSRNSLFRRHHSA